MLLIDLAVKEGRTYITPEDVEDAKPHMSELELLKDLVLHLSNGNCEDAKLCCFVALNVGVYNVDQ